MVVMPPVAGKNGGFGAMELGFFLTGVSGFLLWVGQQLEKAPYLLPQRHPYLEESVHHSYEPM